MNGPFHTSCPLVPAGSEVTPPVVDPSRYVKPAGSVSVTVSKVEAAVPPLWNLTV
jgi:hypothetical protein